MAVVFYVPKYVKKKSDVDVAADGFFFSSRRRHTRSDRDWSSDVCSSDLTSLAYALSWMIACFFAWLAWERESRGFEGRTDAGGIPEEHTRALLKFGMLRAPATLFAQLLFWIDTFVLAAYRGSHHVGVYGATVRTGQSLLLFLTSLSLVFSPFVADLHHRGEHDKLDALYKNVTRWGLATTVPILLGL